jgi:hypothetical protein
MIDFSTVCAQLSSLEPVLFEEYQQVLEQARSSWCTCVNDCVRHEILHTICPPQAPSWIGALNQKYTHEPLVHYEVLAIDGSQVYPDRHTGMRCALINIGGISLSYEPVGSQACAFNIPFSFVPDGYGVGEHAAALVDAERQARELEYACERMCANKKQTAIPSIVLFDGSLIFWQLVGNKMIHDCYFKRYCAVLERLCEQRVLCAWYVSMPKNREVLDLVRDYCTLVQKPHEFLKNCVDTDALEAWLVPHERTLFFASNGPLAHDYPAAVHPHFCYIHSGAEIARVELPSWIAQDEKLVATITSAIIDQCIKGDGYPVALAHAHEQAVIKRADQQLFYRMMYRLSERHCLPMRMSRKQLKKQSLGI